MQTIHNIPIRFVDHIESNKHIMLLHEDLESAKLVMFRFIKNGLINGEDCLYITEEDSGSIVIGMLTYGIPLQYFQNKQLRVIQISKRYGNRNEILSSCKKDMSMFMTNLQKPFRIVSRIVPNIETEEGISVELELEEFAQNTFNDFGGSILCPYDISKIEQTKRKQWLDELRKNHHAVIYVPESGNGGVFLPSLNSL